MDWVQWFALSGGLVAALAFIADRLDHARSDAAAAYVVFDLDKSKVEVHNDGPLPILSVDVDAWGYAARRRRTWRVRYIGSWMTGATGGYQPVRHIPTIGPGSSFKEIDMLELPSPWPANHPPTVLLVFTDGRGRRWVRWPDGRLSRLRVISVPVVVNRYWEWRRMRREVRQHRRG